MQAMRDILRTSLAKSLDTLTPLDRLGAAWAVAAGHATASRTAVSAFHDGVATVTVPDTAWQRQLEMIHGQLRGDLASVSRIPVTDILFVLPETPPHHRVRQYQGPPERNDDRDIRSERSARSRAAS